ncbi:MAG TPA: host attachment protein [Acidobacteriota bacterium]|mgnify:CR=1 FL=1|nr:host attachment protein [Acidobacteriota bacterium]
MISTEDVRDLIEHKAQEGNGVLSVYLNVDQSQAVNLNRGFETSLKHMLRRLEDSLADHDQKKSFSQACDQVLRAVSDYTPRGKTLVLFCEPKGVFRQQELKIELENSVRWSAKPYVRPLLEAFDEFGRYGLVLTDKAHSRLFTVFLDEVQEHVDALATQDVKRIKGPGSDHMRSQMQVQRKADGHARHHLKNVADLLNRVAEEHQFNRLILAGPVAATNELQGLLPANLRKLVIGTIPLALEATPSQILEATRRMLSGAERAEEDQLVQRLITAAAKNNQAVTGLDSTLRAIQEGRVWHIVYADGFTPPGGECANCGSLLAETGSACPYCEGEVTPVKDVVARAVSRVVNSGGKAEQVRAKAAEHLQGAGGVGAFLRF